MRAYKKLFIYLINKKCTIVTGQKSRIYSGFESALKFFLVLFLSRKSIRQSRPRPASPSGGAGGIPQGSGGPLPARFCNREGKNGPTEK